MVVVGVLAIQGAVEEHMHHLRASGAETREIRLPADFEGVDGIVLPGNGSLIDLHLEISLLLGGESTTMAIVGEEWGLFPLLREWVAKGRPIW